MRRKVLVSKLSHVLIERTWHGEGDFSWNILWASGNEDIYTEAVIQTGQQKPNLPFLLEVADLFVLRDEVVARGFSPRSLLYPHGLIFTIASKRTNR